MSPWLSNASFGLTLVVMLVGLFGLVIPVFPGIIVIWLAALIYGIAVSFNTLGWVVIVLITLLMIAGTVIDNILMGVGARRAGATWLSLTLGSLAGLAGTIFFPPFGGILAAPLTVLIIEYLRKRDWPRVWAAMKGLFVGWGLSFVARFLIGVTMIVLWAVWALRHS